MKLSALALSIPWLVAACGTPPAPTPPPANLPAQEPPPPPSQTASAEASSAVPAQPKAWRVGAYLSLSGANAAFGADTRQGIDLAVADINQKGGPKGRPLEVVYADDASMANRAGEVVKELIEHRKVVAVLGEVASAFSVAGGEVANRLGVPMLSPAATNPRVTAIGPFVFRACATDDAQGRMTADYVVKVLGKKKIGILTTADSYSALLSAAFEEEAKRAGGKVVDKEIASPRASSFRKELGLLQKSGAEIIYAPVYYNMIEIVAREAKARNIPASKLVGGDGWDSDELLAAAGADLEGAQYFVPWSSGAPGDEARAFVDAFKGKYHSEPSSIVALGYEAAELLADAIGRAEGETPDAIRAALAATKDFHGITGALSMDADRNPIKRAFVVRITGGKAVFQATIGG